MFSFTVNLFFLFLNSCLVLVLSSTAVTMPKVFPTSERMRKKKLNTGERRLKVNLNKLQDSWRDNGKNPHHRWTSTPESEEGRMAKFFSTFTLTATQYRLAVLCAQLSASPRTSEKMQRRIIKMRDKFMQIVAFFYFSFCSFTIRFDDEKCAVREETRWMKMKQETRKINQPAN